MGLLFCSLDNESHVSCTPESVERDDRRVFCLSLEDVRFPKGNQIYYNIPLSESSEVFGEKN